MNRIKLAVLSCFALVFSAPIGFSTANAKAAEQSLADKIEDTALGKPVADDRPVEEQLADLRAQLAAVRNAVPTAAVMPTVSSSTALLIAGAGVEQKDVAWRIIAGLSPAQAVEVALQEKNEAVSRKEAKK
jgi:alkylation response protein AidB-like acyl-CoA dehydrogenase